MAEKKLTAEEVTNIKRAWTNKMNAYAVYGNAEQVRAYTRMVALCDLALQALAQPEARWTEPLIDAHGNEWRMWHPQQPEAREGYEGALKICYEYARLKAGSPYGTAASHIIALIRAEQEKKA